MAVNDILVLIEPEVFRFCWDLIGQRKNLNICWVYIACSTTLWMNDTWRWLATFIEIRQLLSTHGQKIYIQRRRVCRKKYLWLKKTFVETSNSMQWVLDERVAWTAQHCKFFFISQSTLSGYYCYTLRLLNNIAIDNFVWLEQNFMLSATENTHSKFCLC